MGSDVLGTLVILRFTLDLGRKSTRRSADLASRPPSGVQAIMLDTEACRLGFRWTWSVMRTGVGVRAALRVRFRARVRDWLAWKDLLGQVAQDVRRRRHAEEGGGRAQDRNRAHAEVGHDLRAGSHAGSDSHSRVARGLCQHRSGVPMRCHAMRWLTPCSVESTSCLQCLPMARWSDT